MSKKSILDIDDQGLSKENAMRGMLKKSRFFSSYIPLCLYNIPSAISTWSENHEGSKIFFSFRFKKENRALAVEKISWLSILLLHQIRLLAYDFGKVKLIFLQVSWSLKINKVEKKIFCYCEFWISHLFHNSAVVLHSTLTRKYYK